MRKASTGTFTILIALLALVLAACGDVTVNGAYPAVDYSSAWWWSDFKDVVVSKTLNLDEPVEGRQRLRVDGINGSIVIVGQQGTDTVRMTADMLVGSDTWLDAEEGLDELGIILTNLPSEIHIQTHQPYTDDGRQYVVDYIIQVPSDMEVLVTQTNGHVAIDGIENPIQVAGVNGNIQLVDVSGGIQADLTNGDIEVTATLPPGGEIILSTVNGDVDLRVPTLTSATLEAATGNGNVHWHNLILLDVDATAWSLTGTLGGGDGFIDLETVNGNIGVTGF